jgi:hypothetical protein
MTLFDYVFVISAVMFNLLIAGIFIAQKQERSKFVRAFGITWLCLAFPLAIVFINYIHVGREPRILISFGLIFLYMVVELLLDYVLKIDFRKKLITHVPYIILEYIALFSLIFISIDINPSWGWVVSISFWILMVSLIYLYRGRKAKQTLET